MVVDGLMISGLLAGGAPAWMVAGVAGAMVAPVPVAGLLLAVLAVWARTTSDRGVSPGDDEAIFLRGVAAELASGAGLRGALTAAGERVPALELGAVGRGLAAGVPIDEAAGALEQRLAINGRRVGAAVRLVAASGARAAAVFARLAEQAAGEADLARERAVASAQARLSAWVVAGAPLVAMALLAVSGRMGSLVGAGSIGWLILFVGFGLEAAGVATVVVMLRADGR